MERDKLRNLQDKVVKKLLKEGYEYNDKLQGYSKNDGYDITVLDLKDYLFPAFTEQFKNYLSNI